MEVKALTGCERKSKGMRQGKRRRTTWFEAANLLTRGKGSHRRCTATAHQKKNEGKEEGGA